jgi:hypothetical protein
MLIKLFKKTWCQNLCHCISNIDKISLPLVNEIFTCGGQKHSFALLDTTPSIEHSWQVRCQLFQVVSQKKIEM